MNMKKYLLIICIVILRSPLSFANITELETAIIQQDFTQAHKLANKLLTRDLNAEEAQEVKFYLGLSHLRLGEYSQAREVFESLVEKKNDPQLRDRAYLGLFNSYYLNEEYKQASRVIKKLLKLSPKSQFLSLIYLKMARVNLKLANWREARKYLKKIINGFPNSMEVYTAKQLLEEKHYFAVQVGAFLDRKLAERQVEKLRRMNEYAYILETIDKDNRKFYRVRVGQLTILNDATQLRSKLSKEGYPTQIYP